MTRPRVIWLSLGLKATEIVVTWTLYGCLGYFTLGGRRSACATNPRKPRQNGEEPVGDAVKIPLEEDIDFDAGPYGRTSNSLQLQPTIPLRMGEDWLLIARIIGDHCGLPARGYSGQRRQYCPRRHRFQRSFLHPLIPGRWPGVLGPSLLIPTATDKTTGAGKWGLGPSLAFVVQPNWGSITTTVQNIWSLPGSSQRAPVNPLQMRPPVL